MYVAKLMLNWKDPMVKDDTVIMLPHVRENHDPTPVSFSPLDLFGVHFVVWNQSFGKSWNPNSR